MRATITISLPESLRSELDGVVSEDGTSRSDIVRESLRDYLFLRQFRTLRQSMVAHASAQGVYTDDDVFERIS